MLRSYLAIALRNLKRNSLYSVLNILGLTTGITFSLLLSLLILDEWQYDRHHADLDQLYRINQFLGKNAEEKSLGNTVSPPTAPGLKALLPEITAAARVVNVTAGEKHLFRMGDESQYVDGGYLVDSTFFDLFTYPFVEGSPEKALNGPNKMVLTLTTAQRLFGNEPALGKAITLINNDGQQEMEVSAVIDDQSVRTHLAPNFLVSLQHNGLGQYVDQTTNWAGENFIFSYIRIAPGTDTEQLIGKMNSILQEKGGKQMAQMGMWKQLGLQRVADIRLYNEGNHDLSDTGNIQYIYILTVICVFILLIACINFVNLATAYASKRAAEVGVRKTLGAQRGALMGQFLAESFVIVGMAALLGLAITQLGLPFFNAATGRAIELSDEFFVPMLLIGLGIVLVTTVLSGAYPAFVLSGFQPVHAMKSKRVMSNGSNWLRKGLVTLQFVIAVALIASLGTMYHQLNYLMHRELGLNPTAKWVLPLRTQTAQQAYPQLREAFAKIGAVAGVSGVDYLPGNFVMSDNGLYAEGQTPEQRVVVRMNRADYQFAELMDIPLIAGRNFRPDFNQEEDNGLILNQKAVEQLGLTPETAVGTRVYANWDGQTFDFEVVGVVADFHHVSPHQNIQPYAFRPVQANAYRFDNMIVEIPMEQFAEAKAQLEQVWKSQVPDAPFEYFALNDHLVKQYEGDQRNAQIITAFSVIALLLSCLGLYGLAAFVAEQKVKEIGIRKVLGASVNGILGMIATDFAKPVLLACLFALPLAWWAMDHWLANFPYHISPSVLVFIGSGALVLAISLLTASYQALRAAQTNPVNVLKSE